MNNPHQKETHYVYYLEEKNHDESADWKNAGMWVEVGGTALIICTISVNTGNGANAGFRLIDENDEPLLPYRTSTNARKVVHFSMEPCTLSGEDLTPITFHMLVNCKYARLQLLPADGNVRINAVGTPAIDAVWNHKTISTISVLPLFPHYQGGANTIFTYPRSRTPRAPDDDYKPPVIHKDKINPASSSKGPLQ